MLKYILIFALIIRLYQLDSFAPFGDEKFTILGSQGICIGGMHQQEIFNQKAYFTPADFWEHKPLQYYFDAVAMSDIGAHIPYNLLLKGWTEIFNNHDFSLRLFSILLGLLTIFFLHRLVLENTHNQLLANVVAILFSIEPLILTLNRMIRSYSLSLLLVVISSYLFFRIIQNRHKKNEYLWYVLTVSMALLTHYMNGVVFLAQGIVVLFYVRNFKKWLSLGISMSVAAVVLVWWLTLGGGKYTFKFLEDKNKLHKQIADAPIAPNSPPRLVDKPTFRNIGVKMNELVADQFINTNGIWKNLDGKKNIVVSIIASLLILGIAFFSKSKYNYWGIYGLSALSLLPITKNHVAFFILQASLIILGMCIKEALVYRKHKSNQLVVFCIVVCTLPYLYLIFDAIKSGHTGNLTQRYASFAMPFGLVLAGILLLKIKNLPNLARVPLGVAMLCQFYFVLQTDWQILNCVSSKYNYVDVPRAENPYLFAAKKIMAMYAEGDTVVYPNYNSSIYTEFIGRSEAIDVQDAQYTNIYLPHNALYIQKFDKKESDKIYIRKPNGLKVEIFDFKGATLRY